LQSISAGQLTAQHGAGPRRPGQSDRRHLPVR
jgi:hypothetical protein